eukprot:g2950.t1
MSKFQHTVATTSVVSEFEIDDYIQFASHLANISGEVCRYYFTQKLNIHEKPDDSPVTEADIAVEKAIRDEIARRFPGQSIFGEELGFSMGEGNAKHFLWVIDPIDGTRSYLTGKPTFCTLIALVYDGLPILGVIDQPILHDRWIGALNRRTLRNGVPVVSRNCTDLSRAFMYSFSPEVFHSPREEVCKRLSPRVKDHLFGGDSYVYGLLASGTVDLVCDACMKVYDYMALVPVIEGAGGRMTKWNGDRLRWDGVGLNGVEADDEETIAAGTAALHATVIKVIDWK